MADSGANFTDWQPSSRRRALLVDDDFSWSDAPTPRRRGEVAAPSRRATSRTIVIEREDPADHRPRETGAWDEYPDARSYVDFDRADDSALHEREVDEYDYPETVADDGYAQPVSAADVYASQVADPYALDDRSAGEPPARRTVVITGRGSSGYQPVRTRRDSGSALTRRGFRPDSVAMWAVLLALALLLGSIAH